MINTAIKGAIKTWLPPALKKYVCAAFWVNELSSCIQRNLARVSLNCPAHLWYLDKFLVSSLYNYNSGSSRVLNFSTSGIPVRSLCPVYEIRLEYVYGWQDTRCVKTCKTQEYLFIILTWPVMVWYCASDACSRNVRSSPCVDTGSPT